MPSRETNNRIILPTRRTFLAATTAAAASLVATTQTSHGFLFRQSPPLNLNSLPTNWLKLEGEQKVQSYAKYLTGLRLKYVTPLQVIKSHAKTKGSLWNTLPPKSMWRAMAGTLMAADRVAAVLEQPIDDVVSAYRSPAYNRRCPGAKSSSWHIQNFALDLQFKASQAPSPPLRFMCVLRGRSKGGSDATPDFTHIDTRGYNVDW